MSLDAIKLLFHFFDWHVLDVEMTLFMVLVFFGIWSEFLVVVESTNYDVSINNFQLKLQRGAYCYYPDQREITL